MNTPRFDSVSMTGTKILRSPNAQISTSITFCSCVIVEHWRRGSHTRNAYRAGSPKAKRLAAAVQRLAREGRGRLWNGSFDWGWTEHF